MNSHILNAGGYGCIDVFNGATPFAFLRDGIEFEFQTDGNLIVYDDYDYDAVSGGGRTFGQGVRWSSGINQKSGTCNGLCQLDFRTTGNLIAYYNETVIWQSNSIGKGGTQLVAINLPPFLEIVNAAGTVIWDTGNLTG